MSIAGVAVCESDYKLPKQLFFSFLTAMKQMERCSPRVSLPPCRAKVPHATHGGCRGAIRAEAVGRRLMIEGIFKKYHETRPPGGLCVTGCLDAGELSFFACAHVNGTAHRGIHHAPGCFSAWDESPNSPSWTRQR